MLMYVLDLFDGGDEAPKAPLPPLNPPLKADTETNKKKNNDNRKDVYVLDNRNK
jgi:hypothetical protein